MRPLHFDELFSKLKSTEIDNQSRVKFESPSIQTMALCFVLSCSVSIIEEEVEALGDEEHSYCAALRLQHASSYLDICAKSVVSAACATNKPVLCGNYVQSK